MFLARRIQWIFWPKTRCQHQIGPLCLTDTRMRTCKQNGNCLETTVFCLLDFFALESLSAIVFHRKLKNVGYAGWRQIRRSRVQKKSVCFLKTNPEGVGPSVSRAFMCADLSRTYVSARMPLMWEDGNRISHLVGAGVELMGSKVRGQLGLCILL